MKTFGQRLKSLRTTARMSQESLAHAADMHAVEVGLYERGERNPCLPAIIKLCRALGCTPNDLIEIGD